MFLKHLRCVSGRGKMKIAGTSLSSLLWKLVFGRSQTIAFPLARGGTQWHLN